MIHRLVFLTIVLVAAPLPALAYVDPGTTGSVFSVLAMLLSGVGMIGAFLIRPIMRVFRRKKPASSGQQPTASNQPPADSNTPPTSPAA